MVNLGRLILSHLSEKLTFSLTQEAMTTLFSRHPFWVPL